MDKKKAKPEPTVDEKRVWARKWMKANPAKVTVMAVNDAVKHQFGVGFGKQVVSSLVRGTRTGKMSAPPPTGGASWVEAMEIFGRARKLGIVAVILSDGRRYDI